MQVGKSNIWASQKYSDLVREILDGKVKEFEYDYAEIINTMRQEISHNNASREPSWQEGTWWFDNMTIYIDTLKDIQRRMAEVRRHYVRVIRPNHLSTNYVFSWSTVVSHQNKQYMLRWFFFYFPVTVMRIYELKAKYIYILFLDRSMYRCIE